LSPTPMARNRRMTMVPSITHKVLRDLIPRNASVNRRATHSAVGFAVTSIQISSLRSSLTIMKA
jgi:hypothetical protein